MSSIGENPYQDDLQQAYDNAVDEREGREIAAWKVRERSRFMRLLRDEGKSSLVDIGAGPGLHAIYFKARGITVTCIDLSPENVKRCIEKGLVAHAVDVMNLSSLGTRFESAFAMNSLLHIPRRQLSIALTSIRDSLDPDGLFYWGQYGGEDKEGVFEQDHYEPKRFFSWLSDDQALMHAQQVFHLEDFKAIPFEGDVTFHFQSLILRNTQR